MGDEKCDKMWANISNRVLLLTVLPPMRHRDTGNHAASVLAAQTTDGVWGSVLASRPEDPSEHVQEGTGSPGRLWAMFCEESQMELGTLLWREDSVKTRCCLPTRRLSLDI